MEKCYSKYANAHLTRTKADTSLFALGGSPKATENWRLRSLCPETGRDCKELKVRTANFYTCKGQNSVYHMILEDKNV